ncbi:MAG: hypothetical protein M3N93_04940, partial [Acidobacteriota bacterium]|nr:hypothetical protein [Acidobacteriota bacterium]
MSCTNTATIAAGGNSSITVAVNVAANATNGSNTAQITTLNCISGGAGCSSTVPYTFPGVSILKTASNSGAFTLGGTANFTLQVSNAAGGASAAIGAVTVTDAVPAALTVTSATGAGWNCAATVGQNVSCTNTAAITASGNSSITVAVNVSASATNGSNTAQITTLNCAPGGAGGAGCSSPAPYTLPVTSPPTTLPDMTISKTHTGTVFAPNSSVTFTLTASNVGTGATSGTVTVQDNLPSGLTATAIGGTGWSCLPIPALQCTRSDSLGVGQAYPPIGVTATIAPTATGTLVNNANVSGGGETNLNNDQASDSILVLVPDMTITKSHTGTSFSPGGSVTFSLVASNVGQGPTLGAVTVSDSLPAGLSATAISGGATWSCTLSPLTCTTNAVLAAGAAYPAISVTATITQTTPGTLVNNATVGGGSETNLSNDQASDSISIAVPDMTIGKTHTGTSFSPGGSVTFTLTASNVGAVPTIGPVTVTDSLPAGLTATAISGGSTWSCTLSPLACSTTTVLAAGAAYPAISLTAGIAANASGTFVNNTTVGGGGEVNLSNDNASDSITVTGLPDMTITKSHTGTAVRGSSLTYTLTASNVGGIPTAGTVTVTDTLPAGLTATTISGPLPWTCTLSSLTCTTNTVLAPGAAYPPIAITALIGANAPNTVVNTAVVGGGGETNLTNDTATDPATVTGSAPFLQLTKTFSGNAIPNGVGSYAMVVTNTGTGPTVGVVTLVDPVPAGLSATAMSGSGWDCVLATLTCTRSDVLVPGASYPAIILAVVISANPPAQIVNIATVSNSVSGNTQSTSANSTLNPGQITSLISVTKIADRSSAEIGDVLGYQIVATNNTPTTYPNALFQDTLPTGFAYIQGSAQLISGTSGAQPITPAISGNQMTFTLSSVAPRQIDTITYRVRVTARATPGSNVNTAQFVGSGPIGSVASPIIRYSVLISAGLFTRNQFLIGRVFEDANENGSFDKGERPVAGVRLYLSNGASASTDSQGLYNIPLIVPGTLTVSIDRATIPKGYIISSGGRLDAESTSRLVRTPLQGGMILRQNFALKKCGCAAESVLTAAPAPPPAAIADGTTATHIEIAPQQPSLPANGRSTMKVVVRILDAQGKPTPAKEIRVRSNAGQFVPADGSSILPLPGVMGSAMTPGTTVFGANTKDQLGRTTEQVPESLQAGFAKGTNGEATFTFMAGNQPGEVKFTAETGDPAHLLSTTMSVYLTPEKDIRVLSTDGELSVGKAAMDRISYGQTGLVARHADAFMRTSLGNDFLLTLGYTSHMAINATNGNAGLFQLDPLDRAYPVFGDSSTQYYAAQSNSHVYGRLDHDQSYLLFGDMNMGTTPFEGAPVPSSPAFSSQSLITGSPSEAPAVTTYGVGDYARKVVGAALHLEDKNHDSITIEGARPNSAYARDIFSGSTFGLVQLSHIDIVPGSDTGVFEVRNRYNPEILISRETLVRSVDYTIDPATGSIFFLRSLNQYDESLNLTQLVFTYEYRTIGQTSSIYAIRGELRLNSFGTRAGFGITDQRDPTAGNYYLGDFTLRQHLPNNGRFSIEVPVSHGSNLAAGLTSSTTGSDFVNGTA